MLITWRVNKSNPRRAVRSNKTKRGMAINPWVVGVIPFFICFWAELRYTVNMPYWDDYDSVLNWLWDFLHSTSFSKRLSLLLRQHNEHRIVFDRIIELFEFHCLGAVNFIYLDLFGFIGLLSLVFLLVVLGKRSGLSGWALVPIPFFMLSLSQHGLIAFAMASIQVYWALVFSFLSFLFATKTFNYEYLLIAFLFGVIASFTSAGGLIGLPVVFLYYLANRRYQLSVLWFFLAVPVFIVYFILLRYQQTAIGIASHDYAYAHPVHYARYVLMFLGNMARTWRGALATGIVLVLLSAYFIVKNVIPVKSALFVAIIFVVATAAADGLSRISLGMGVALSSRYTPFSAILISVNYIGIVSSIRRECRTKWATFGGIAFSIGVYSWWLWLGIPYLSAKKFMLENQLVYPSQSRAASILDTAMNGGLFMPISRIYRNLPTSLPLNSLCRYRKGYFGNIDSLTKSGNTVHVAGWAAIKRRGVPAATVIIDINGNDYPSMYGMRRPDIVARFGNPKYLYTGYQSSIAIPHGARGVCHVSVVVIGVNRNRLYRSPEKIIACGAGGS